MDTASILIVGTFVVVGGYFIARMAYIVVGGTIVVLRATRRGREQLHRDLESLSVGELRGRLLQDPYLVGLRGDAKIERFLARLEEGDLTLASEYPRRKLYRMLCDAERSAGGSGRPEAVDAAYPIWAVLNEMVGRAVQQ
jgi:hypothetical protein